jgi:amidase
VLDGASMPKAALKAQPMIAYTALWNVTGHPAASLPAGFGDDGLPTAVQLVARRSDEATLFGLSAQVESVRPWADRWPTL